MTSAIPIVPSVFTISGAPAAGLMSQLALNANSLPVEFSAIVNLGATSPLSTTYNAAGAFESLLPVAVTAGAATTTAGTATSVQTLAARSATDSTALSVDSQDALTLDQILARQLLIDLYSSATGLGTAAAASAAALESILQELPANSTAQSINSLLSTNLGLPAAALLDSAGAAATITTASNGTWITTLAPTANPSSTDIALAVNSSPLGNVDLTAASTVLVASRATGATADTGTVGNATPPLVATLAAATPAASAAAPSATVAPANPVAPNAGGTAEISSTFANGFLLDSVAQAANTIERNPAYASAAAGLYLSAMIFHLQHAVPVAMTNTADSVQPVAAQPSVSAVKPVGE